MNLIGLLALLLGQVLFPVVAVGLLVAFVAALARKWRIAGWAAIGTLGIPAGIMGLYALLVLLGDDPYVRHPVENAEVVGTYYIDNQFIQQRLQRMGYEDLSGHITLSADGSFTATQIPACCIHGWDESSYPFSGGYYSLEGTWKVTKSPQASSDVYVVHLMLSKAELTGGVPVSGLSASEDRSAPSELDVHLMKETPIALGFSIFNGDFDEIVFSRRATSPSS